jgi:hypothetical protein
VNLDNKREERIIKKKSKRERVNKSELKVEESK